MTRGAAFFDLDRTLLVGASGSVFSQAMREAGLVNRSLPGESLLYRLFNTIGETLPSMALARQGANLAKGRSSQLVQQAAENVADALAAMVQPLAAALFDEHRAAGRPIVLATTTPHDLVKPLADRLGLDDVVATRYGVNDDGTYNGTLNGPFVWSAGKLAAVREWATRNDVDLAESFAYSDSFYDTPLLSAVGHPFVVNPDPRMVLMAAARRWPTINLGAPRTKPVKTQGSNMDLQRLALNFTHPVFFPYAKFRIEGTERIPAHGAAIIVGNHRSYFDAAAIGVAIAQTERTVRFLGKKEVFDAPVLGQIAAAMGGIRVDRGTGSDEPLQAAAEALANGDLVAMMPQGTIPRGKAFYKPVLKGRWGAARLAALANRSLNEPVPVIPIGLWGTEKVWPRSARIPNVLNVVTPPTVTIKVGKPITLSYEDVEADTEKIMKAIMALLPEESRTHGKPTKEEIALALPPGYKGDQHKEKARRPGTD